jgi:hypothetical protein
MSKLVATHPQSGCIPPPMLARVSSHHSVISLVIVLHLALRCFKWKRDSFCHPISPEVKPNQMMKYSVISSWRTKRLPAGHGLQFYNFSNLLWFLLYVETLVRRGYTAVYPVPRSATRPRIGLHPLALWYPMTINVRGKLSWQGTQKRNFREYSKGWSVQGIGWSASNKDHLGVGCMAHGPWRIIPLPRNMWWHAICPPL